MSSEPTITKSFVEKKVLQSQARLEDAQHQLTVAKIELIDAKDKYWWAVNHAVFQDEEALQQAMCDAEDAVERLQAEVNIAQRAFDRVKANSRLKIVFAQDALTAHFDRVESSFNPFLNNMKLLRKNESVDSSISMLHENQKFLTQFD